MSGRKYIGIVVFNQNIDQYSKYKKDSLKREIYDKMVSNEYFIKNINVSNKTIKLKGNKAFVEFKETVSPYNDNYKKRTKDKSMFNWAQKNFKRSMNFNKKMFLDDSLKAVKISVKKDNKTKKRTRKHKKNMNGGFGVVEGGLAAAGVAAAAKKYKDRKTEKEANEKARLIEDEHHEGFTGKGFTVDPPPFISLDDAWREIQFGIQEEEIKKMYPRHEYERILGEKKRGWPDGFYLNTQKYRDLRNKSEDVPR